MKSKVTTKQLTTTALLLAICILSQFFKNLSPYITGPIVNATLIIATLGVGLWSGLLMSIISPITAFLITGSPLMATLPILLPLIMLGNAILVIFSYFFNNKIKFAFHLPLGLLLGSITKALVMGILAYYVILPYLGTELPDPMKKMATTTFTIIQLPTALMGSLLAFLIWVPIKSYLNQKEISA